MMKTKIVFRHRWEKDKSSHVVWRLQRNFELGFWFKKNRALVKIGDGYLGYENHYMLGLNLLVCKLWLDIG